MNRWFRHAEPFKLTLPRMLGQENCLALSILDVGAGDGALGNELRRWAKENGWDWCVTNLDLNPTALACAADGAKKVVGSALELPFADGSFDVVIGSQMAHHLKDEQVIRHFEEGWRVARRGLVVSDLHRNAGLYAVLAITCLLGGFPQMFTQDCVVSVKRGWRLPELKRLAEEAGIQGVQARLYFGARVVVSAVKP